MFTMLVGEIDAAGDHKIATRFFSFVGPLFPLRTMCITHESFEHRGGGSRHSYMGEDVKLSLASVALGYLRVWSWIAVLVLPFILFRGQLARLDMLIPSAWAAAVGLCAWVLPGLLMRDRRKRLEVVRVVSGLGCDPARRYDWPKQETLERLTARIAEHQLPTSPEAVLDRLSSMPREQLQLVFTWAWYRADVTLREAAWSRLRLG